MRETVLLSGGADSATVLAARQGDGSRLRALFVDLGQPARVEECASATAIARHFRLGLDVLTVTGLNIGTGEILGRNLLLLSLAAAGGTREAGMITMGIHAGTDYWDCGGEFVETVQTALDGYTGGLVQLHVPFLALGKRDVARLAEDLKVPFELTYSCERSGGPCGRCLSCEDRITSDAAPT